MELNQNQGNLGTPEGAVPEPTGNGTQTSSPQEGKQVYDFAGIKVESNDPMVAKAHQSYINLQRYNQDIKNQNKQQTSEPAQNNQVQQPVQDKRVDYIYNRMMESDFKIRKEQEYDRLSKKIENFDEVKKQMDMALSQIPLEQRMNVNIEGLATIALGQIAMQRYSQTPDEMLANNQQLQQSAINNPNVRQAVIGDELNRYQQQETLPPNMPSTGNAPVAPEVEPAHSFREAGQNAKRKRMEREGRVYR